MKKCKKCGEEKEDNFFNKTRSVCKKCRSEYNKKYRLENIIEITSRQKKQRDAKKFPKIIKDKEEILKEQKEHKKYIMRKIKNILPKKQKNIKLKTKKRLRNIKEDIKLKIEMNY